MYEMHNSNNQPIINTQNDPLIQDNTSLFDDNNISQIENNMNNHYDEIRNEMKNDYPTKILYSFKRPFSKLKRKMIFILIFIINILVNVDHGAIPAGTTTLKKENNLDIRLAYREYPDRAYDSPVIYGDNTKILEILKENK